MNKGSTLFLKLVIIAIGLVVLIICGGIIPYQLLTGDGAGIFYVFWGLIYATTIPFYIALYQGLKLLMYSEANTAFSQNSIKALQAIKFCALAITVLYVACLPFVFCAAELDDAPGLVLLWAAVSGGPIVIAVFAALLQTLLQNVLKIKSENDLTV